MPLVEIEVGLTDLELAIRDTAHKFPAEVLRPAGEKLDRMADPADVSARLARADITLRTTRCASRLRALYSGLPRGSPTGGLNDERRRRLNEPGTRPAQE